MIKRAYIPNGIRLKISLSMRNNDIVGGVRSKIEKIVKVAIGNWLYKVQNTNHNYSSF